LNVIAQCPKLTLLNEQDDELRACHIDFDFTHGLPLAGAYESFLEEILQATIPGNQNLTNGIPKPTIRLGFAGDKRKFRDQVCCATIPTKGSLGVAMHPDPFENQAFLRDQGSAQSILIESEFPLEQRIC
jgi:hypothetical protein